MALNINQDVAYKLAERLNGLFDSIDLYFTDEFWADFHYISGVLGYDTTNKYCYVEYTLNFTLDQSRTLTKIKYYSDVGYVIERTDVNLTLPSGNVSLVLRLCIPYQL
jgi:hypothetical protein